MALGDSVVNSESAMRRKPIDTDFSQDRIFVRICIRINDNAFAGQWVYLWPGLGLG